MKSFPFLAGSLLGLATIVPSHAATPTPSPFHLQTPSPAGVPGTPAPPANFDADRSALLQGIAELGAPGVPGGVCAFGPQAFAVIAGKDGKKALQPVVAAARWEKGRVVALGHNGYLNTFDSGNGVLLLNAARWAAGDATSSAKPKIGVVGNAALVAHLKTGGFDAEALDGKTWNTRLPSFRAVFIDAHKTQPDDIEHLARYVRNGGGLVTAATGWGWLYGGKEKSLLANEFAGNKLLAPAGLVFTAGTPEKTTKTGYTPGGDLTLLNASAAIDAIANHTAKKVVLTAEQLAQAGATLDDALRSLPASDTILLPRIAALSKTGNPADFPRPDHPLTADNASGRLAVTQILEAYRAAKPEQLHANPAADVFPGAVPKSAPRIPSRVVVIDTGVPAWHSTGLYAAPGELIKVQVPAELADKGLAIRIGCHTDGLWHLEKWQRAPEIARRDPIKTALSTSANPFGGLIYIEVPDKLTAAKVNVAIGGGVEAPRFVLGETKLMDWKMRLRAAPAPWAELETKKVILSVPTEKIRQLDDPETLMKFWDQILDAEADLASIPRDRKRPERIVPDVQISAGYMHSGYPIMTPLDKSVEHSLSVAEMKQGSWGHFHELGHNHQVGDWTFDGTTEVTCNLFSLYCMETLCGKPPGQGHDAMKPENVDKRLRGYLSGSDKFARWKSDPFLALIMYSQLRNGFGWETYKKVFAEYRDLPKEQRPKTDEEKHDQWMVRYAKAAGKNLGPFFEAWGVPTSTAARDSIKSLPAWMPPDWPKS
jgi:hypothetical protein